MRKLSNVLFCLCFMLIGFISTAQTSKCACACEQNLLKNPGFQGGTSSPMTNSNLPDWSKSYKSPDYSTAIGCKDPGVVSMWGNKTVGEGIHQTISNLVTGNTYRVSFSMKANVIGTRPKYAQIKIRASDALFSSNPSPSVNVVGISRVVQSTEGWVCITLNDWIATGNFTILTISVENEYAQNDGEKTSNASIDNICLQNIPKRCTIEGPPYVCASNVPATYTITPTVGNKCEPLMLTTLGGTAIPSSSSTITYTSTTTSLTITSINNYCGKVRVVAKKCLKCPNEPLLFKEITILPKLNPTTDLTIKTVGPLITLEATGAPTSICSTSTGIQIDHQWELMEGVDGSTNCEIKGEYSGTKVSVCGPKWNTEPSGPILFSCSGLQSGKTYVLMHGVYYKDYKCGWYEKRKCFRLDGSTLRLIGEKSIVK